jgi:exosortase J
MSVFPNSEVSYPATPFWRTGSGQFVGLAILLAILGLSTIWPPLLLLWTMWTTDALKSIGMMIPPISLILILHAWWKLGWRASGTWWGLVPLLVAIAAVWFQRRAVLLLIISPHWATPLPPPSLVLVAYSAGVVLLVGGPQLFRACLFPIALLWFANPVPRTFSLLVDLPLQALSAQIARAFAMHLGQPLTPDHLRLMFTPEFGMFIAPGCNGIRGAVTMGFIALIAGYIYRFRWYTNAIVVVSAILLGYLFNLLRLCLLVLYYLVALHFPSLQNKAENADYLIGAILFLLATILLFTAIHKLRERASAHEVGTGRALPLSDSQIPLRVRYSHLIAMTIIALVGCIGLGRATGSHQPPAVTAAELFPSHVGGYSLVRTWNENLLTGPVVYVWAQYAPPNGGNPIAIGISPLLGSHDPLLCHATRGDHPLWQGPVTFATAESVPVSFSSAFYSDGVTQSLEASTQCTDTACGESATERTHFGLIYTHPDPKSLLSDTGQRVIPVLLRAETTNMTLPATVARQQLNQNVRDFLTSVKLDDLTHPYQ